MASERRYMHVNNNKAYKCLKIFIQQLTSLLIYTVVSIDLTKWNSFKHNSICCIPKCPQLLHPQGVHKCNHMCMCRSGCTTWFNLYIMVITYDLLWCAYFYLRTSIPLFQNKDLHFLHYAVFSSGKRAQTSDSIQIELPDYNLFGFLKVYESIKFDELG